MSAPDRRRVWQALTAGIERYLADVDDLPAGNPISPDEVAAAVARFDFTEPLDPAYAIEIALDALRRLQPHVRHRRHFGLFDAAPTTMGVAGDALAAAFNPCLASWAGSPFGVAAERHLVNEFGRHFGFGDATDGILTSGGSEANVVALMLALTSRHPRHRIEGVRGLDAAPVVYHTAEAHPSVERASALAGLGTAAAHRIPVGATSRMRPAALAERIRADRDSGLAPLLVTVTAGTTAAGVIDPIAEVAEVAREHGLWLHVDAAWGGAAALLPELAEQFRGIELADSLTFDPHKWMSVPIGAGLLLTRHPGLLARTFQIGSSFFADDDLDSVDPSLRSPRWSRGFSGLKILLSLAVAGWDGYRQVWRRQVALGERLRDGLRRSGWRLVNDTALPVVCFDAAGAGSELDRIARVVNESGQARIYRVTVGGRPALRVCVTNYDTTEADIDLVIELLDRAREEVRRHPAAAAPPLPRQASCDARLAP
ncbi:MAG: pyridoxal phosphate-dependent decarboxylase family protein [Micromonosporaceae bacterium]